MCQCAKRKAALYLPMYRIESRGKWHKNQFRFINIIFFGLNLVFMNTHSTAMLTCKPSAHFYGILSNMGCQYIVCIAVSPLAIGYMHIKCQYGHGRSDQFIQLVSFYRLHRHVLIVRRCCCCCCFCKCYCPHQSRVFKMTDQTTNHNIVHDFNTRIISNLQNEKQIRSNVRLLASTNNFSVFGRINFLNELFDIYLRCN